MRGLHILHTLSAQKVTISRNMIGARKQSWNHLGFFRITSRTRLLTRRTKRLMTVDDGVTIPRQRIRTRIADYPYRISSYRVCHRT